MNEGGRASTAWPSMPRLPVIDLTLLAGAIAAQAIGTVEEARLGFVKSAITTIISYQYNVTWED